MLKIEELDAIKQQYQLTDKLEVIESISQGDVNEAYLLADGLKRFVVKKIHKDKYVSDYGVELKILMKSLSFSEHIAKQLYYTNHVTAAYPVGKNEYFAQTPNYLWLLYPKFDAEILDNSAISVSQVQEIARFLYTLHHSNIDFDQSFAQEKLETFKEIGKKTLELTLWNKMFLFTHRTLFLPNVHLVSDYLLSHQMELKQAIASIEGQVLCHNDLKPKNVLWNSNHFWVVDWETAGIFDAGSDYIDSLISWCTVDDKTQIFFDQKKLQAFLVEYPLNKIKNMKNAMAVVIVKWFFWLAFCLSKLLKNPKKIKSHLYHIRSAINRIVFLINTNVVSHIEKTERGLI